jgi:hypothetical protein
VRRLLSTSWFLQASRLTVAAFAVAAVVTPAGGASAAASSACGGTGTVTTASGSLADGAAYEMQCPAGSWNGTLFLYSHGYVVLLRQLFVSRAGHCAFTPAETIAAVQVLLNRISTGRWDRQALEPASLNAAAAALGAGANIFSAQNGTCPTGSPVNGVCATTAAYVSYRPARYLRPFNLGGRH